MKLTVLIVEDDPLTAEDLKEILTRHHFAVVGVSSSYEEALKIFSTAKPQILLADITLKGSKDGIELVNKIHETSGPLPVVYLTGNSDDVTKSRAFKTNPSAFLSKPFNAHTVIASLELAINRYNKQKKGPMHKGALYLFVKKGDIHYRFKIDDINYFMAEGSYSKISTDEGEFIISGNLKSFENRLYPEFIRIHKSCLVNMSKVTAFDSKNLYVGSLALRIGRNYKDEVKDMLK